MALQLPRFYRSESDFGEIHRTLKLVCCPECKVVGALNRHGATGGYDETDGARTHLRTRRVFCSHRKRHNKGCGRTFSIRLASNLKRLRLSAATLGALFNLALALDNTAQALRDLDSPCSISSAYRLKARLELSRSHLQTVLSRKCTAPSMPDSKNVTQQTLAHLEAAFPDTACPITEFQLHFQTDFLLPLIKKTAA